MNVVEIRRHFLQVFLPVALFVIVGFALYGRLEVDREFAHMQGQENLSIGLGVGTLSGKLEDIARDLAYLSKSSALLDALENADPVSMAHLEEDLVAFSLGKGVYDQLRWIDETGMERVRVDYFGGRPAPVARNQLQNKGKRYFFSDSFRLAPGEVFVSPLDLNVEQNEIEVPYKPTVRVATPIVDRRGVKRGIVILNYQGRVMLDAFAQATMGIADRVMLLNGEGYWLKSPHAEEEWGFMLKKPELSLASREPEAWNKIRGSDSGQLRLADGLWTWRTVYPLVAGQKSSSGAAEAFVPSRGEVEMNGYVWKVVSLEPNDLLSAVSEAEAIKLGIIASALLGLFAFGALKLARAWVARDVAEDEVRHTNAGLALANHDLRMAKELAEESSRAKTAFLANMSHELRTPMNGVLGMLELAKRRMTDSKGLDQLKRAKVSAEHLLAVLNDILDISRLEASRVEFENVPVELHAVAENLRSVLDSAATEKGLALNIDLAAELACLPLMGDPMRLAQILINLVSNGIKFTDKGSVTLRVLLVEERSDVVKLRFEVIDTGIGIEAAAKARLFRAFEQADNSTTRKYGGTGLGLAICKRLVESMGGEIGVESDYGCGSTFWFVILLKKCMSGNACHESAFVSETPERAEQRLQADHAGKRILLVEEEPVSREVSRLLLEDVGFVVDTAEDGQHAIQLARDNRYALILMDMEMSALDGLDAARIVRADTLNQSTPILAMTSHAFGEDLEAALAAGMDDHVDKPIVPEKLYATLAAWAEKATAIRQ